MKRLLVVAVLSAILGGCAVYGDGDRHYYGGDEHWGNGYHGFEDHGS